MNANKKDIRLCYISQRRIYAKKANIYSLSRIERKKVQEFLKNQLRKEYITIKITTVVFFVLKKNRKKRMVQDY